MPEKVSSPLSVSRTAQELIHLLNLSEHPEGGHFREIYRSAPDMHHPQLGLRPGVTIIHYLLQKGERSLFHRIRSEEVWQFVTGAPLELLTLSPDCSTIRTESLSLEAPGRSFFSIPPGVWQAARTSGEYSLVLCTVSPGFFFSDLEFLSFSDPQIESLGEEQRIRIEPYLRIH
ncbi:cupin domain-containing protein [Leptospirillum ferriphilum]|jgi:predicted cupin superfamily sugar epimerase|uniref:DUF985 domain-containing protein n=1 Tax=Leptospirillum sp. Group II '5-way CG' TaxID=419541 RepID=B6ARH9_9BACT|nr:MAG: Conserved protein of unknown function [Leptospirillum sp. Group II '5-way CG']